MPRPEQLRALDIVAEDLDVSGIQWVTNKRLAGRSSGYIDFGAGDHSLWGVVNFVDAYHPGLSLCFEFGTQAKPRVCIFRYSEPMLVGSPVPEQIADAREKALTALGVELQGQLETLQGLLGDLTPLLNP